MPCFKGLAVSIHTPNGPLPEYSVQRQSRASRIACYIPVPPPKLPDSAAGKPEQSTFAVSITLLTPDMNVPYSKPKPTPENPNPKPRAVGGLSTQGEQTPGSIAPYRPLTSSPSETVAAYIYFDGRQKEEVATLLKRGEETWVNSRWVGVPDSEGGGIAEREFLFREVGLERWLNGLDLEGKDAAERIERRRQKLEKKRRKRELLNAKNDGKLEQNEGMDMDDKKSRRQSDVLRYGANAQSPVEGLSDDDELLSGDSDLEDDDPIPETTGQIKVAVFRVLASGEIKRGEYSPQFNAHDDDDESKGTNGGNNDADVDHTTSFAKPKSLDPKNISTQTVTGIDPTDRPYAVYTFMYRGERQLQKMGILNPTTGQEKDSQKTARRKSGQPDFAKLGPLKPGGAAGFVNFRDNEKSGRKKSSKAGGSDMDSDDDDEEPKSIIGKVEEDEDKEANPIISTDDASQQGELAEGVRQIKLKRQHSAEPLSAAAANPDAQTASKSVTPASRTTPPATTTESTSFSNNLLGKELASNALDTDAFVGSPLKKQRASVSGATEPRIPGLTASLSTGIQQAMAPAPATSTSTSTSGNGNGNGNVGTSMLAESVTTTEMKDEDEL